MKYIDSTLPTSAPPISAARQVARLAPRKNSQYWERVEVPEKSAYLLIASRLAKKNGLVV